MSRTYRKTSTKHGHPRSWGVRHMATMDHTKAKKPAPYPHKPNLTKTVVEQYTEEYCRYNCPEKLRIYVNKGTPLAIEEHGAILEWEHGYVSRREPSRWYLVPPPVTKTRTYRRYIGPNPDFSWDEYQLVSDAERLFDHVRRNRTGGRGRNSTRYRKRRDARITRLEGKRFIQAYVHEDHIWHDDFTYEDDDWYDEMSDNWHFYEMLMDEDDYDEPDFYDYGYSYEDDYYDWGDDW